MVLFWYVLEISQVCQQPCVFTVDNEITLADNLRNISVNFVRLTLNLKSQATE